MKSFEHIKCYESAKYGFCLLFKENTNVVGGIVHVPCRSGLFSVHCDLEQCCLVLKIKLLGFVPLQN